jgi:hypothetical protein
MILLIYLGFLRDSIFININYIIDKLYYNKEVVYYHSMYFNLVPLGVSGLGKLKWVLTLLFTLVNGGLSWIILKNLFKDSRASISLLLWGYGLLFIIAALLFIGGKVIGVDELGYTLSRRFMGVLQSPVPLMVVAAVHLLFGTNSTSKVGP